MNTYGAPEGIFLSIDYIHHNKMKDRLVLCGTLWQVCYRFMLQQDTEPKAGVRGSSSHL